MEACLRTLARESSFPRARESRFFLRLYEPFARASILKRIPISSAAPGAVRSIRPSPKIKKGFSSRAIIDATKPYEWAKDFPKPSAAGEKLKKTVSDKYGKYFR